MTLADLIGVVSTVTPVVLESIKKTKKGTKHTIVLYDQPLSRLGCGENDTDYFKHKVRSVRSLILPNGCDARSILYIQLSESEGS